MPQIKRLLKSPRVRITLVLLCIAIAVVVSFFLPKEPDPNIGLANDTITPTVGVTHPVGSLAVNRGIDFQDVYFTVTKVEEAGAFSDDRKHTGIYTVRVHIHVLPDDKVQAPLGIKYDMVVHLILADGQTIAPKFITLAPVVFPKQAQDGFFDFPVPTLVSLPSLTLRLGEGTVAFN